MTTIWYLNKNLNGNKNSFFKCLTHIFRFLFLVLFRMIWLYRLNHAKVVKNSDILLKFTINTISYYFYFNSMAISVGRWLNEFSEFWLKLLNLKIQASKNRKKGFEIKIPQKIFRSIQNYTKKFGLSILKVY